MFLIVFKSNVRTGLMVLKLVDYIYTYVMLKLHAKLEYLPNRNWSEIIKYAQNVRWVHSFIHLERTVKPGGWSFCLLIIAKNSSTTAHASLDIPQKVNVFSQCHKSLETKIVFNYSINKHIQIRKPNEWKVAYIRTNKTLA